MGTKLAGRVFAALVAMSLCGIAVGETRNSTTSVGVRVERHIGLYLPSSSSGVSLASLRDERTADVPRAFGNSQAALLVSGERPAALSHVSSGGAAPRVAVTAFEP